MIIKREVLKSFAFDNTIESKISEAIIYEGENEEEERVKRLLEVCKKNCDCVIYSGI